ncbi:MAG TPA: HD-GYP domain-containing protein [Geobacteraceae bacterium]
MTFSPEQHSAQSGSAGPEALQQETDARTIEVMRAFANAIEARDEFTRWHSTRVADISRRIARKLDLSERNVQLVYWAATVHDVGKIGIPEQILKKKDPLNIDEIRIIRQHPQIGASILYPIGAFKELIPIIQHHHERFDGTGYPDGLKGAAIPFLSRIVTAADAFEAMTSDRCYRKAYSCDKVLYKLQRNASTQFDPVVVDAVTELAASNELGEYGRVLDYVI